MQKALAITVLIAVCMLLLSAGIITVAANGGPTPVGVPVKQPEAQAVVIGVPQGFPVSKGISQISIVGSPHEEPAGTVHP
jgi:hypothetical protein